MTCPYCHAEVQRVTGEVIYSHRRDLYYKNFWSCEPCGAYVGCHEGGNSPLGRLANKELRQWKMNAHAVFDPIWRTRQMSRSAAYGWLAESLGIKFNECHIGMFDVDTCKRVVEICKARRFSHDDQTNQSRSISTNSI